VATNPRPDNFASQAQAAVRYYQANRAAIDQAANVMNQMRPVMEMLARDRRVLESMWQDMNLASILARQHAAFTAMAPTIPVPTEAELAEAQDRITELVPATEEEREEVAQQAAGILADPEGKQLISQVTGWLNERIAQLGDTVAAHPTYTGLALLAVVVFLIPPSMYGAVTLYVAIASAWMQLMPPPGK
jgi:hypothetical protein